MHKLKTHLNTSRDRIAHIGTVTRNVWSALSILDDAVASGNPESSYGNTQKPASWTKKNCPFLLPSGH